MNKSLTIFALLGCVCFAGCIAGNRAVPSTTIQWNPATGQAKVVAPKNSTLEGFEITRTGSNATIRLQKGTFANDPEVVGQSYAGQAALFQAGANIAGQAIQTGIALGTGRVPAPSNTATNK